MNYRNTSIRIFVTLFSNCSNNQQPFILTVNFKCAHNKTIERQTLGCHNSELHTLISCVISYNHDIFFAFALTTNLQTATNLQIFAKYCICGNLCYSSAEAGDHIFYSSNVLSDFIDHDHSLNTLNIIC